MKSIFFYNFKGLSFIIINFYQFFYLKMTEEIERNFTTENSPNS